MNGVDTYRSSLFCQSGLANSLSDFLPAPTLALWALYRLAFVASIGTIRLLDSLVLVHADPAMRALGNTQLPTAFR